MRLISITIIIFLPLFAHSQIDIKELCVNEIMILLDTSWIRKAEPSIKHITYQDDDFEEYDAIHYFKGKLSFTIYQKDTAYWPGNLEVTKSQDFISINGNELPMIGSKIEAANPKILDYIVVSENYETNEQVSLLQQVSDVYINGHYTVNGKSLIVEIVIFLKKGVVERISLNFSD